ncbi:hypothetical protein HU200_059210 [Digitaria exilis]|uniref:Uncharacterized protein n=1 Tax=Digitaria exilis TaxID=1010633 RepID=A0A835ABK3_9POAL|nr:hypothetical protein HU200_059210 [Digitaria exilis]CAB3468748.1 unnamed protein product [Digitaria exilis]
MDESWRCTIGSVLPRQRSSDQHLAGGGGHQSLAPDDFRDVYGGPPRTVLLRSFAGEAVDYHSPTSHHHQYMSYGGGAEAFFRRPYAGDGGRAAAAVVPTEQGFFDDIFGARRQMRSRSRSNKSKSSSAVSSDELPSGFCRPVNTTGGRADATLSSFTSRLRPVTIPSRRYDSSPPSSTSTIGEYQSSFTCSTAAYPAARYYYGDGNKAATGGGEGHRRRHERGSSNFCCFTSNPETSSNAASFRQARGGARSPAAETTITDYSGGGDYGYYYSPPSATSSLLFTNPMAARTPRRMEEMVMEVRERAPLLMDDGDDIDSVGAAAVDEAIAWAKERFWSQAR